MIKWRLLFIVYFMTAAITAKVYEMNQRLSRYQCDNCGVFLSVQDILMSQATSVRQKDFLFLCKKCREEKQKGGQDSVVPAITNGPSSSSDIVPYEEPHGPFKESLAIAKERAVKNQQQRPKVTKKKWWQSFIALFSRSPKINPEIEDSESASLVTLHDFSIAGGDSDADSDLDYTIPIQEIIYEGRWFTARPGSLELGVRWPFYGGPLGTRRSLDLLGKFQRIIDYNPYGFLIITDAKKPLLWYSKDGGLKAYSEALIQRTVSDPIIRERIKSHDLKYHVSSLEEQRQLLKWDHEQFMNHNHDYAEVSDDVSDSQSMYSLPHIYERPLNSTDYTRHVQAILEQRRPVTVYWGSMAYTEM